MWFFMILCYVLTALSFSMFFINGLQGYFKFLIFQANHATFALLSIIVYLLTQTLIIFFFVGIGVSIKEYMQEKKITGDFHKRTISIKRKVYPPQLLNMLLFMGLFISGGMVDTKAMPGWLHGVFFLICFAHFVKVILVQHESFKSSTQIVLDMVGIKR